MTKFGYSHSGLEDFLRFEAHSCSNNPIYESIYEGAVWDKKDRLTALISNVMCLSSDQETLCVRKWLHQCMALALNDFYQPVGAAGVLVFHGNKSVTPLLEKLAPDELLTVKAYLDSMDADSRRRATATWITELSGLYPEAKSFFLASHDMHRPLYASEDEPKARRTSFCVSLPELPEHQLDSIYWPVCTEHLDLMRVAELDKEWVHQLWMQVYEELYIPNPKGFTLSARSDQENSALKFYAKHMDFFDNEMPGKPDTEEKIYEAYLDWCKKENRVAKRQCIFFADIKQYLAGLDLKAEQGFMLI